MEEKTSKQNMVRQLKPLCLIPARGGSKRIPRKNIRIFAGKPMITWVIETALESNIFERVIVSTDDTEIAEIAVSAGANIPFLREKRMADDFTTTASVTAATLLHLSKGGMDYDLVCCLYPTAVFTTPSDIVASHVAMMETGSSTCLAIAEYQASPYRALTRGEDNKLKHSLELFKHSRSQDLPRMWHDAGQFCWSCCDQLIRDGQISMLNAIGHEMKRHSVIDIDDEIDFLFAEKLFLLRGQC